MQGFFYARPLVSALVFTARHCIRMHRNAPQLLAFLLVVLVLLPPVLVMGP